MARKELTKAQIKTLLPLTHNKCAMHSIAPHCEPYELVRDGQFFGEFAHISAAEPLGERYITTMSDDERNSVDNIIVLCPNHHTVIDKKGNGYTVESLKEIKRNHEQQTGQPELQATEELVDEVYAEVNSTVNNINSGNGTMNVNTFSATGQTFYMQPPAVNAPPSMGVAGLQQLEQSLTLSIAVIWHDVSEPPISSEFVEFAIGGRKFIILAQEVYTMTSMAGKDASGKYNLTTQQLVQMLDGAKLVDRQGIHDATLLQEIRSLAHTKSLTLAVETENSEILLIPFNRIDADSAGCQKIIKLTFKGVLS